MGMKHNHASHKWSTSHLHRQELSFEWEKRTIADTLDRLFSIYMHLEIKNLIIWGGILRKIWIFKCRLKLQKEDYKKRKANEWIHARGMTLGIRDRVNDSTNHNKCNAIVKYKKVLNLNSLRVCHFDLFFSTSRQKNLTNKISIFQDSHICSWLLRNFYD